MSFEALAVIGSTVAGGLAAVTGFGIGSLLTPKLALQVGRSAGGGRRVGTARARRGSEFLVSQGRCRSPSPVELWLDQCGRWSGRSGLSGMARQSLARRCFLDALLLFAAGESGDWIRRTMRFRGVVAWLAGAVSGLLGGLVGNRGGIRSAAFLGFDFPKHTFIGTATAIGLLVDGARMPVYVVTQDPGDSSIWQWVALASVGVCVGTVLGNRTLPVYPKSGSRRILAGVLAALGTIMVFQRGSAVNAEPSWITTEMR